MPLVIKTRLQRNIVFGILIGVFLAAYAVAYYVVKDAVDTTVENQAISVAEIVAIQATTARSVYDSQIAGKLQRDGFGPHVSSDKKARVRAHTRPVSQTGGPGNHRPHGELV